VPAVAPIQSPSSDCKIITAGNAYNWLRLPIVGFHMEASGLASGPKVKAEGGVAPEGGLSEGGYAAKPPASCSKLPSSRSHAKQSVDTRGEREG
jgi:hypothetical protein